MKKVTFSRFYTYGLIGCISLSALVGAATSALTQTARKVSYNEQHNQQEPSNHSAGLIWPSQGILSQGFNKNRHIGIDIAGPPGTPVVAAASGQVVKSGWDDWGLGNFIRIHHSDGSFTVYGHNRRLLVKNGQQITQGQVIAEMGNTGNSSGPHLHFEVHPHDMVSVVDPIPVLPPLVAGKIPSQRIATIANSGQFSPPTSSRPSSISTQTSSSASISIPVPIVHSGSSFNPTQTSSSESIPIPVETAKVDSGCNGGRTVIAGETATTRVKVCQENGEFFYIGQSKQNREEPMRLPARIVGKNRYQADNGSFSYFVTPQEVQVWQNGNLIHADSFSNS
jgi:lysostaphin